MAKTIAKNNAKIQAPPIPVKEERNIGVELFRVVSMILVVLLHVLGHGGVYSSAGALTDNYKVAWFLELWHTARSTVTH